MAYDATSTLTFALEKADRLAVQIFNESTTIKSRAELGGISYSDLHDYMTTLDIRITDYTELDAQPGIVQFARDQKSNQAYDIGAEFNAMITNITAVRDWLNTNLPLSSGGFLEEYTRVNFVKVNRTFTVGQAATLVTVIDDLLAAIEV